VLLGTIALGGCRLDMHIQPKYRGYEPSNFFHDGHSEQQPVPGTVAQGELRTDTLMYAGLLDGKEANVFPFPITRKDLERGQQRFDIYCTPCHDFTGSGHGMVVQRGFPAPPSYYEKKLMDAPVGHFFRVMTYGYGTMYSYADRLSTKDRWRIAAYIRALQMTHQANMGNVPPQEQKVLEASSQ
jgi:cytochrome c553